jgi:hypothetical protein
MVVSMLAPRIAQGWPHCPDGRRSPAPWPIRIDFTQTPGDIHRTGHENHTAEPFFREPARQRQSRRHRRHGMMKRGIETGDLKQMGRHAGDLADGGQIVGLMQRRERREYSSLSTRAASILCGAWNTPPPCTTLCPTATISCSPR